MLIEYCQDIDEISAIVDNSEQNLEDLLPPVFCLLAPGSCLPLGLHIDWLKAAPSMKNLRFCNKGISKNDETDR